MRPLAVRAGAGDFDHRQFGRKAGGARGVVQALRHRRRRNFADRTTALADQKSNHRRRIVVMRAGEIRVAAFDAVNEAVLHQEIQRAVNRDRRRPRHRFRQFVDHLIGAERAVARQQRLQHLAADRREFPRPALAHLFGVPNRVRGTAVVIVVRRGESRFGRGHVGGFSAFAAVPPLFFTKFPQVADSRACAGHSPSMP